MIMINTSRGVTPVLVLFSFTVCSRFVPDVSNIGTKGEQKVNAQWCDKVVTLL